MHPAPLRPSWTSLPSFARAEADRDAPSGWMRPRLLLFVDGEPVVYVRSRGARAREGRDQAMQSVLLEMTSLSDFVQPTAAAIIVQGSLSDHDGDVRPADDPTSTDMLLVRRAWLDSAGAPTGDATMLPFGRSDTGEVCWLDPIEAADGPFLELLHRAVRPTTPVMATDHTMDISGVVYALTKFGHVIAVDPLWHGRLGLDQPVAARQVRPIDRDRARRLVRHHRAQATRAAQAVDA